MLFNVATASLFSLSLFLTTTALSHGSSYVNRHHDIARRVPGDVQLHKRFGNSRWSFYDVGQGACGQVNQENDFIVALNSEQYGGGYPGPNCFKKITMSYKGKTAQATIMDECPGCGYGGLDLSRGLFRFFASEDEGIIYGSWEFGGGGGGGGGGNDDKKDEDKPKPSPKPKTTPKPEPTTTKEEKKTTSKEEPTTTKSSTTSSKASSSSASSSSHSSSAVPSINYSSGAASGLAVPTGTTGGGGNLNQLSGAIVNMGGLVCAGAGILN